MQESHAGPVSGGVAEKERPLHSVMKELTISRGFTEGTCFLNSPAAELLIREGYITAYPWESGVNGGCLVTAKGAGLGFRLAQMTSENGKSYSQLLCGEQAQQFLRDSMDRITALERQQWEPLLACLTPEWHSRAPISERTVSGTDMVKQISGSLPPDLPRQLSIYRLRAWMVKNGFMQRVMSGSKCKRFPSKAGEVIGIVQKKQWTQWTAPAQRFVCDNLDWIVRDIASGEAYRWGPREVEFSEELRRSLRPAPGPVRPSYLEAAINGELDGGKGYPDRLPKKFLISWLYREKYIAARMGQDGEFRYFPTEKGEAVGLVMSEGILCLSETGQQFAIDHLHEILEDYKTL